jgi:hypothetical protein
VRLADAREPKMSDTSGRTYGTQFAHYDLDTHSWKTWPGTGLWGSIEYSETWPKTGCMSDGRAFELPTSVPRIIASDSSSSSLLPTPNVAKVSNDLEVTCSGDGRERPNKLGWAIAMLPTPKASGGNRGDCPSEAMWNSPDLGAVSVHFPTPTASDATGGGQHPSKRVGHTRQLIDTILVLSGEPTPPLFDVGNV